MTLNHHFQPKTVHFKSKNKKILFQVRLQIQIRCFQAKILFLQLQLPQHPQLASNHHQVLAKIYKIRHKHPQIQLLEMEASHHHQLLAKICKKQWQHLQTLDLVVILDLSQVLDHRLIRILSSRINHRKINQLLVILVGKIIRFKLNRRPRQKIMLLLHNNSQSSLLVQNSRNL